MEIDVVLGKISEDSEKGKVVWWVGRIPCKNDRHAREVLKNLKSQKAAREALAEDL